MVRVISGQAKPGERPCRIALVSGNEWQQMHDRVLEGRRKEERAEQAAAKTNAKIEMSKFIASDWPNTLINKQKQRQQRIIQAIENNEKSKVDEYHSIMRQRAEERAEKIETAKKIIFESTQNCRTITSGVILSEVIKEREKQVEMTREQQKKEYTAELEETARRRQLAEEFRKQQKQEQLKLEERMKLNKQELDDQLADHYRRRQIERDEEEREKEDMKQIQQSLAEEAANAYKEAAERRAKKKAEEERWLEVVRKHQQEKLQQEMEEDQLNEIYQTVKDKLDEQRKAAEKRFRDEQIQKRAKFAAKKNPPPPAVNKEEMLAEARRRREMYDEETKADAEERRQKKEQRKLELQEIRREALQKEEELAAREREIQRYEILQRMAVEDATKRWNLEEEKARKQKQKETNIGLVEQWEERLKREEESKKDPIVDLMVRAQKDADQALLDYCDEIESAAVSKGQPLYPIRASIQSVLKTQGILEKQKKVPFLQSRVPIASVAVYETEKDSCPCYKST